MSPHARPADDARSRRGALRDRIACAQEGITARGVVFLNPHEGHNAAAMSRGRESRAGKGSIKVGRFTASACRV
jgi:hypothetical protein